MTSMIATVIIGQGMLRAILAPENHHDDEQDARIFCELLISGLKAK
jgi:hypothetical protein